VLVDFHNIDPSAGTSEAMLRDVLELIDDLVRRVLLPKSPSRSRDAYDVELRLYDGWIDKGGNALDRYRRTIRLLPESLEGLKGGVRVHAEAVTSLACSPRATLKGTYVNGGQKMVDQMLAQDLRFFAAGQDFDQICLVANDDDYVPAILATASECATPIVWLRARERGRNDDHLQLAGIHIICDDAWRRGS
jgi:hypothetical protein